MRILNHKDSLGFKMTINVPRVKKNPYQRLKRICLNKFGSDTQMEYAKGKTQNGSKRKTGVRE